MGRTVDASRTLNSHVKEHIIGGPLLNRQLSCNFTMASLSQPLLLASQHPSHHQLSRRRRRRLVPPGWTFWALTAGLAATIALSAFLLVVTYTHKTFGGRFHDTIITGRATVQIFVQVISHLLSLIQVFALLWLFKLYTIEWIRRGPVALDCLKWWNSVSTLQLDRSLPWHFLLSLIILISKCPVMLLVGWQCYTNVYFLPGLSFVPGAFWAGAITPIVTTETIKGNFSIPYYGLDPQSLFWNQSIGASTSNVTRLSSGSFSYSPVRTILGSMLDSAAAATAPTANNQTHRKLDNTGYTFQGRSFGVGASVGLAEPLQHTGLQSYTFVESGLMANITCWYNRTMDFHVSQPPAYSDGYPLFWYGCGVISSGGFECIRVPGDGDSEVVVMGGDPYEGHSQWAIATGRTAIKYSAINQTSCEVYFNKQGFSIMVDRATHFITVTPLQNTSEQFDPSMESLSLAARMLQFNVVQQIGMVVQTSASLLFTPLGSGKWHLLLQKCFFQPMCFPMSNDTYLHIDSSHVQHCQHSSRSIQRIYPHKSN